MSELSERDDEHLRVMLRETTDHLRLPERLTDTVRTGAVRRTRRHRALGAGLGIIAVTMAVTAVAMRPGSDDGPTTAAVVAKTSPTPRGTLPDKCLLHVLATPADGQFSSVTGGDPSGRYLLTRSSQGAAKQIRIWTGDSSRVVAMTGEDATLYDVNTAGTAVGSSFVNDSPTAWLYRNGAVQRLAGDSVSAKAINSGNLVVGLRVSGPGLEQPVVWRALDRPAEQLPLPDGALGGRAVDVADDGTIVGVVHLPGGANQGYVWLPNGEHRQLPPPVVAGRQAAAYWPTSIHGTVIDGTADVAFDQPKRRAMEPVMFDLTTGTFTAFPEDLVESVGNGRGIRAGQGDGGAVLSDGRRHVRLDQLATQTGAPTGVPTDAPTAPNLVPTVVYISDDARTLAGRAADANGLTKAVVWRCQ
ncbi:hypothetical protein ACPPVO_02075 [Dactylosporangium sp. McL0621]|uniref:hypothetical protein n=1 Tax=Dactylosporangium sp. McL0621 TaxID=3415678 RepID=UPI003CED7F2C